MDITTGQYADMKRRIKGQDKHIKELVEYVKRLEPLGRIFGYYTHQNSRKTLCLITQAYEQRGTVDIIIFDNGLSGGVADYLNEKKLGTGLNEVQPFLNADDDVEYVAAPFSEENDAAA